ncbi:MAG: polyprenyl synthetase family protein [Alloprevotella sp.]
MDSLSLIRKPVAAELEQYRALFDGALQHDDDFLGHALAYVRQRRGKMMRPLLVLLMAKELGKVGEKSLRSAVTLELLHTASLVHDDVVDESQERRGQRSANAVFDNKVAVLLGDYLLSQALLNAAETGNLEVVRIISRLGGTLSEGEISQLAAIRNEEVSEDAYFHIIHHKTAALFAACARLGAISAGGDADYVERATKFGELIGICFQIRDDIFDYFSDGSIGKPTGNDMREGKLTLPAIHALKTAGNAETEALVKRIKSGEASSEDIASMVEFTVKNGGIDYARQTMKKLRDEAVAMLEAWQNEEVRDALKRYMDFVIERAL